ncbi:Hypp1484 [Branchiostoma lanceolatum]|uniref:Hypp1484 protein n=1 Tax=Branchiostoma lanceolatum TaxID=7740 RepID=A0A8J9ZI85_BRALA|nr:Hypp1484 [Branchiostoma lanceolatum]
MKNLAALVMVLTVALLADVGHGWRRRSSLQKKEESGLQIDGEAAEFVEEDEGLEMKGENDGGLEEEEETDGGLVMEKLEALEDELDVLKEGLQKG